MAKLLGDYAAALDSAFYADVPKAVFAAVALAIPHNGAAVNAHLTPEQYIATEWHVQHRQGLIPQPVPARWRGLICEDWSSSSHKGLAT